MDGANHTTAGIPRTAIMTWVALVLAALVFALDIGFLDGQGESVLYVVVVLTFLWSTHWRYVLWIAGLCTVLTLIGFYNAPKTAFADTILTNHIFSFAAIWLTAILGMWMNHLSDKLSVSERRTRMIVESAAEGILTTDDHGRIESCNEAGANMFGYERDELIGLNFSRLSKSVAELAKSFELRPRRNGEAMKSNPHRKATRELTGVRRDGTEFPMLVAASEMWLHKRRLFAGIILDMTELRAAQEAAIQSARLAAIGEAMAGLAHESRNALQRSQAALEMLAREVRDQNDAIELIDRIQAAQEDLHNLYEEVRGYAAPMKLTIQSHRIDDCVKDAWEKIEQSRRGRDVELRCHPSPDLDNLTCEFDSFVMRRVFRNLFENSLAAADDPVRIDVTFSPASLAGNPAIAIRVNDNGPGLSEAAFARLFQPFFTTKTTGTGLGMAIIRRSVEGHRGTITSPWPSEGGAEFLITLPRTQP